jgi:hypothetical protein
MSHTKQTTIEMYSHLYGKEVTMDDRFETKHIWSEELALKNKGRWIPQEESNEETIITAAQSYAVNKRNRTSHFMGFMAGAEWMEKQMENLKDFDTWKEWKNKI